MEIGIIVNGAKRFPADLRLDGMWQGQQHALARTFGCVRVVWNRTLAVRHQR
jgi:hypothetical protein